jgi:nucleoside-diphosphate-sugar epimerase
MFDYIYARDSADALLALIDSNAVGTYDVGTGKPHRVEQVLDQLSKEFLNLRVLKAAETPIYEASCADITRISTETGWQPKVSLAQGVKEIVEFETSLLREKKKK